MLELPHMRMALVGHVFADSLEGKQSVRQPAVKAAPPRPDWQSPVYALIAAQVLAFLCLLATYGSNAPGACKVAVAHRSVICKDVSSVWSEKSCTHSLFLLTWTSLYQCHDAEHNAVSLFSWTGLCPSAHHALRPLSP